MNDQRFWKILTLSVFLILIASAGTGALFATAGTARTEGNNGKGNERGGTRSGRGEDIYVDADNGHDDTGNGSEGNPYKTIQKGVNMANNGDTVLVKPGTYTENVDINKPLTIRSTSGNPKDTIVEAANANDHVFDVTADYVNISGFTATGATGDYKAGINLGSSNHSNIYDNNAYNNNRGIRLYDSSNYNNLSGNYAYNNSYHGIQLHSSSNYNNISGNYAYNNSCHGIDLHSSSNYNNISGNYAYNNSGHGIDLHSSSNYNNLSGNYAYNNSGHGIHLHSSSNNNLSGNYAYNNSGHGISLSSSSNYNNLSGNYGYNNSYDGIALYNSSNYNNLSGSYAYNNSRHGISLQKSSNYNTFTENTASNNTNYDFYSDENSHDNTVEDLSIGTAGNKPTTISFTYDNGIGIKGVKSPPSDPTGKVNIGKYVNITGVTADSRISLDVSYDDDDPGTVDE